MMNVKANAMIPRVCLQEAVRKHLWIGGYSSQGDRNVLLNDKGIFLYLSFTMPAAGIKRKNSKIIDVRTSPTANAR